MMPSRLPIKQIFIQIASYRDPELSSTVRDLLAKACWPSRISIGICIQLQPNDTDSCGSPSLPSGDLIQGAAIRLDCVPASESKGVCWARARTQNLWDGEPFTLQIDSHMRFVEGWDEKLIASWQRCDDANAVVSGYPNAFTPPDFLDEDYLPLLSALHFDEHGILRLRGINTYRYPDEKPIAPVPSAFVAAGFLFGPSSLITRVPYDPSLYFYGEEISMALRLWTHGFNLYNPDRLIVFHLYKTPNRDHTTHWADHADWDTLNQRSISRTKTLMSREGLAAPYGLGSARSLEVYQAWSGVNFAARTLSADAKVGRFRSPPPANTSVQPPSTGAY